MEISVQKYLLEHYSNISNDFCQIGLTLIEFILLSLSENQTAEINPHILNVENMYTCVYTCSIVYTCVYTCSIVDFQRGRFLAMCQQTHILTGVMLNVG